MRPGAELKHYVWEAYADALEAQGKIRFITQFDDAGTKKHWFEWDPVTERHSYPEPYIAKCIYLRHANKDGAITIDKAFEWSARAKVANEHDQRVRAAEAVGSAFVAMRKAVTETLVPAFEKMATTIAEAFTLIKSLADVSQDDFEVAR